MKRFKIIALFLLIFSFGFSEEGAQEEELQARVTQLEQQIETQNKIIARYERLEDKLNDRVLETLDLNNKVDDFYNSAWNKLLFIITGAFAGIGLLLPYLQNKSFRETKEKIEKQEKKQERYQNFLKRQSESLNKLEKDLQITYNNNLKKFEKHEEKILNQQSEITSMISENKKLKSNLKFTYKKILDNELTIILKDIKGEKEGLGKIGYKSQKYLIELAKFFLYFEEDLDFISQSEQLKKLLELLEVLEKKDFKEKSALIKGTKELLNDDRLFKEWIDHLDKIFLQDEKFWTNEKQKKIREYILKKETV